MLTDSNLDAITFEFVGPGFGESDLNSPETDGDCINDLYDLEPLLGYPISFSFVIKSYFVMDDNWDNAIFQGDEEADVYFKIGVRSRGSFDDEWKDGKHGGASISIGQYPNYKGIMNDHHESYGSDHIKKMNERFIVKALPSDHYQMLFTLRMYDDDTWKDDELIDISPTETYTLEVFYDVVTGMWAVWKDMDKVKGTTYEKTYLESASNLLEGVYLYRNANDTYTVIRETDKGKHKAGVGDGIGYVTGYEKGSKDLGEAGGIQFEIVPCDKSNRTVGLEYFNHYQDFDYDGLTSLSEWFWSNYTFFHNGKEMNYGNLSSSEWDSDGDMLSDGWEIRYGFDPCSDTSPNKNDDDGDEDGIITRKEFCLNPNPIPFIRSFDDGLSISFTYIQKPDMYEWGAQPDRKDIFVEVDWMEDHETGWFDGLRFWPHTEHFELKTKAKDSVVLAFYRACRLEIFITLHIDNGCMGGGEDVPLTDSSDESISLSSRNTGAMYDDYYDYRNGGFFETLREHIFHYCIYTTYINYKGSKTYAAGVSWLGYSDAFMVAKKQVGDADDEYRVFMHELGHNIIGNKYDATHSGSIYLDDLGHHDIDSCNMHLYHKGSTYCSRCWREIDLASSLK